MQGWQRKANGPKWSTCLVFKEGLSNFAWLLPCLVALTLFQGHRYVSNLNCKWERERERLFCLTSTEASRPIRDGDEWEKGDRRVKPQNEHQPRRPRLPWTAARTTKCSGSVCLASHGDHRTTQLLFQLLCGTVTETMSVAPPLGNNWSKKKVWLSSPAPPPCSWSLLG